MSEIPYFTLDEIYELFGYTNIRSCYNAIAANRFPVHTYKIGRTIVADRAIVREFFRKEREAGAIHLQEKG
jgi:hypothetical protein